MLDDGFGQDRNDMVRGMAWDSVSTKPSQLVEVFAGHLCFCVSHDVLHTLLTISLLIRPNVQCRTTTPDVNTVSLAESDEQLLPSFVASASQNVRVSLFKSAFLADAFCRESKPAFLSAVGLVRSIFRLQWRMRPTELRLCKRFSD